MGGLKATKQEHEALQDRLAQIKDQLTDLRKSRQSTAESGGDYWHDNPAFTALEARERALMAQIEDLEFTIGRIEIVEGTTRSDVVEIGSTVVVEFEDGSQATYTIAGHMSGDPEQGRIAYDSPLGNALMGSIAGETRSYDVGPRKITVTVKEVGLCQEPTSL